MAVQQNHHTMEDLGRSLPNGRRKVFVQRDYSEGTTVRFLTKFPVELENHIDKQEFEHTINSLNSIYHEAEQISGKTYCEGCFACLTAFILYACIETHYEKCLKKAARFIQEQNMTVWGPRGLVLTDPAERGLRVIEVTIMADPRS